MQTRFKQAFKSIAVLSIAAFNLNGTAAAAQSLKLPELFFEPLPTKVERQRDGFISAERKAASANEYEFSQLAEDYGDYPLWPYIESAYLQNNMSLQKESQVLSFMQAYQGTTAERRVRNAWLAFLARRDMDQRYIRDYIPRGDAHQDCRYLRFRWEAENDIEALSSLIERRWVRGQSQPRTCDPVFAAWEEAGERTDDMVWRRLQLTFNEREWRLSRYLIGLLPEAQQVLAEKAYRIHRSPAQVGEFEKLPADDPRSMQIVTNALRRLIWQNQEHTLRLWPQIEAHFEFDEAQVQEMEEAFAIALAVRGHDEATLWFERLPAERLTSGGRHWQLASLLRGQDFEKVLNFIESLPVELADEAPYLYWQARSLDELKRPLEADVVWGELATRRHYYGFMASARMGAEPSLNIAPLVYDPESVDALAKRDGVKRAYEFLQLGKLMEARSEWNLVRSQLTENERKQAVILASRWQWLDQSIHELARLGLGNDVERRFPLGFQETLTKYATQQSIDPAWAFAVIRRESAFQADAVSPVGAQGLMQVMPDTAEYLLRRTPGRPRSRSPDLHHPEENIRLGTRYLADLLRRNDNNWLLATASYNAGINRVREWLPEGQLAADLWIETIPYQETRDYVKAVLAYQQIYTMLLGRDDNILDLVHSMRILENGGVCYYAEADTKPDNLC
ncbi:transglycosylase SLT domain-containing protein [Aliidiomarina minuta]|nr:transglycosylase SLT domain-containing protein [Aliidiomarina minuta]